MKNANTRNPAAIRLTRKLPMMSGTIALIMLVNKEITKNVRRTRLTM